MIGRLAINKGLELLAGKNALPITGEYCPGNECWHITVGEPGAPMQAGLHVSNDSLSALIEELTPYLLNKQEIPADKILDLIRPHLRC